MIQLSYQASFDPYHSVFRLFRLFHARTEEVELAFDAVRILDFYVVFPFLLQNIELKRSDKWIRAVSKRYDPQRPFAKLPDPVVLFNRMLPYQMAAVQCLTREGFLSREHWAVQELKPLKKDVPERVAERVAEANRVDHDLMRAIVALSTGYEVLGPDGLKARSRLMEFRYDAV